MKGLLTKDFLTVKKKYGIARLIMDLAIIAALMIILEGAGSIYISFLLVPLEVASMLITLANSDEQWKWGKYRRTERKQSPVTGPCLWSHPLKNCCGA